MICEAGQKMKKYEMYKEERKMKCNIRRVVLMLMLFVGTTLSAQNISVASFKLLENDLTANTTGTMERDQNGEAAALIKVVTTQQGFVFDGGMVGIVKTKQGVGEVWVYVPHGIKKITIQHPQLGVLRDYYFPIAVEKARTYEMVLTTGRVETVVTHSVNKQFVVFNVTPTDAIVELNDEILSVDSEGNATKGVAYGTYNYRVSCANYHTEAGQVTVTAEGKAEVNVTLRPNFGWIKLDGDTDLRGAHVYIDNVRVGQLPFVSEKIKSGNHRVKIVKNMYKPYEQQVVVKDNETSELNVEMIPNFAVVTLTTDAESEIWIDGVHRGKGRWNGRLEIGDYTVEVKKESHRTASQVLHINTTETQTLELKSPTPIYALLEVSSNPLRAVVYIDGIRVGETPLMKSDVLVGSHRVKFEKEGYGSVEQTVVLEEGKENQISVELSNVKEVYITSVPGLAKVSVDGVYKGITPFNTKLNYGEHTITFERDGYNSADKSVVVNNNTSTITHTLSEKSNSITITSSPSNAGVKIDGIYKGVTPYEANLSNGSHKIELTKSGYKSYIGQLTLPYSKDKAHYQLTKLSLAKQRSPELRVPRPKKKKKPAEWGGLVGLDAGYSTYGFNYGGDIGIMLNNWSLLAGVRSFVMGRYSVEDYSIVEESEAKSYNRSVQLLRFNANFGHQFAFKNLEITPQLGIVYGPSFFVGKAYVMNDFSDKRVLDKDYTKLNQKIMKFARMRCGVVLGTRLEYRFDSGFGFYVIPEYIIKDGVRVNAGFSVEF